MSEVEKLKSVLSQITKSQDNKISNEESHSKNSRLKSKPLLKINSEEISGEIKRNSGKLLFCGLSPWEGEWSESLEKMLPDLFITAKYEAWPEIWCALSLLRIPLCIIGAKKRTSLMLAKKICYFLKIPLPQMILIPGTDSDTLELRELFPRATLQTAPDPRWDRIFERSKHNSLRVQKRISEFSLLPRPWGMLGQVWLSDFKIWDSLLKKVSGTIWIIPHSLDPRIVDQMKEFLSTRGLLETVDSVGRRLQPRCLFIAEMGLLAELYSVADWVYVGGGFGKGVHNTMEPAIYGVPIAIGPKGQNGFSEIEELKKQKQLTVVRDSVMLDFWLQNINKHTSQDRKYWKESALILRGGTKKIDSLLSLVTRNV